MASGMDIPSMDWTSSDLSECLALFKQKMNLFIEDENITNQSKQALKICRGLGDEGLRRLNASGLTEEQKKVPVNIWNFLEGQLKVNINFRIHRLQLMQYRQASDETLDDFVTRAKTLAHKCELSNEEINERLIELIILSTPHDSFRKELLGKARGTTIKDVLTEGRKHEALAAGNQQLNHLTHAEKPVDYFRKKRGNPKEKKCGRCDRVHNRGECPAYNSVCELCNKRGHWQVVCRSAQNKPSDGPREQPKNQSQRTKSRHRKRHNKKTRVHAIQGDLCDSCDELCFDEIKEVNFDSVSNARDEVFTVLKCQPPKFPSGKYSLKLKIDTGAS